MDQFMVYEEELCDGEISEEEWEFEYSWRDVEEDLLEEDMRW